ASSVQASSFVLRYLHNFRFVFKDGRYVYFLFSRTLGVQENRNFTFAAYISTPGLVLAKNMSESGQYLPVSATDPVLFVTFSSDEDPSRSALCMYPVPAINQRLQEIIQACYSEKGIIDGKQAVYYPYTSKTEELCTKNEQ
ncbi:hypothetical protein CRUP_015249, partial [Coryphaenoides rupestris]